MWVQLGEWLRWDGVRVLGVRGCVRLCAVGGCLWVLGGGLIGWGEEGGVGWGVGGGCGVCVGGVCRV